MKRKNTCLINFIGEERLSGPAIISAHGRKIQIKSSMK